MDEPKESGFGGLEAQSLFCPICDKAQPVRTKLLLALPTQEKYAYFCAVCGGRLGVGMVDTEKN